MSKKQNDGKKVAGDANSAANIPAKSDRASTTAISLSGSHGEVLVSDEEVMAYCDQYGEGVLLHVPTASQAECAEAQKLASARGVVTLGHGAYIAVAPGRPGFWVGIVDETLESELGVYLMRNGGGFEIANHLLTMAVNKVTRAAIKDLTCACNSTEELAYTRPPPRTSPRASANFASHFPAPVRPIRPRPRSRPTRPRTSRASRPGRTTGSDDSSPTSSPPRRRGGSLPASTHVEGHEPFA